MKRKPKNQKRQGPQRQKNSSGDRPSGFAGSGPSGFRSRQSEASRPGPSHPSRPSEPTRSGHPSKEKRELRRDHNERRFPDNDRRKGGGPSAGGEKKGSGHWDNLGRGKPGGPKPGPHPRSKQGRINAKHGLKNQERQQRVTQQVDERGMVILHGDIQMNRKGFGFLLHSPKDIFVPPDLAAGLMTGDRIKAWYNSKSDEIVKVEPTKRGIKQFIGTYQAHFDKRVVTLVDKHQTIDVALAAPPGITGLRHGHKVLCEITKYDPQLEGKILQTFGPTLAPKLDTLAVVVKSQWPQEFSKEVLEFAENIARDVQEKEKKANYVGRKDHREKTFVTIDGADARDFDDAICVEKTSSGYVLYVAIADVSSFVIPGSVLDKEAFARSTSVYFPEWVIPMLPEALSNGACSLRPDEEKLTLTAEIHFDLQGNKRSQKVYDSVIRSHRRCIYEDVQKEFAGGDPFWKIPYELYNLIRQYRKKRGSIDLDLPEAKIILDEHGDTSDIRKSERQDSNRLIEEFMIAANEAVTELAERERWPFVFRIHEPPEAAALERFESFALALGIKSRLGDGKDPKLFSQFVEDLADHPSHQTLHYLLLRSLKQARYDPLNLRHFGLASRAYSHFTSPIRRYPDLMVHRLLKRLIRREAFQGKDFEEIQTYLAESCKHCSYQERKAQDLDRTVTKIKKARFMEKRLGETFRAKITGMNESGFFVELDQWFVEGLVPMAELGNDYYEFFEDKFMIRGKRSGQRFRLADELDVTVLRVDIDLGQIDFTLSKPHSDEPNS